MTEINQILNLGDVESRWEQYDFSVQRITTGGNPTDFKAVIQNGNLLSVIRGDKFVIPNEEALSIGREIAKQTGLTETESEINKLRMNATFISDKINGNVGKKEVGDIVQFGIRISNGVDGLHKFSASVFSYRLWCKNGASDKENMLIMSGAEIMKPQEMRIKLSSYINSLNNYALNTITLYNQLAEIKLTEQNAPIFAFNFNRKILPEYITVPRRTKENPNIKIEVKADKNLWDVFNDITFKISHENFAFDKQNSISMNLHKVCREIVNSSGV